MTILEKMRVSCKEQLDKAAQEAAQELVESRPGLERKVRNPKKSQPAKNAKKSQLRRKLPCPRQKA